MGSKLYDFYTGLIGNFISGGELISRQNLSSLGIRPLFDRIVTKSSVKKVVCVTKFPLHYDLCLPQILNGILREQVPNTCLYTSFYSVPSQSDFSSNIFKSQMARTEEKARMYNAIFEERTETEKTLGKRIFAPNGMVFNINRKQRDALRDEFDSYKYIADVLASNGAISDTFLFLEIITPDNKTMKSARSAVIDYLRNNEFKYAELSATSSAYMSNFSPASYMPQFTTKEFQPITMSHENLTYTAPWNSSGFIGDGKGQIMGMDMKSNTPFTLNFTGSGSAQIVLVLGTSGDGKTFFTLTSALSFLSSDIHVSALDIKGDEWIKLSAYTDYILVDISESSSRYVNTMRIDDLDVDTVQDATYFYDMAISATAQVCTIAAAPSKDVAAEYYNLILTAVKSIYNSNEIHPDVPASLRRSANLEYNMILPALERLKTSTTFAIKKDIIDDIIIKLSDKLMDSKLFSGEEITMTDILQSPLVIYSLNKNKSVSKSFSLEDEIRTFMISFLDMKKIAYRKSRKKFTLCVYEEMQRAEDDFSELIKFISSMVTGARSSNAIIFLLGNSISTFTNPKFRNITSNITSYFVSPLPNKTDRQTLANMGCADMLPYMETILEEPNKYKNYFVCKYNTGREFGVTTVKAVVPNSIAKQFATRDEV